MKKPKQPSSEEIRRMQIERRCSELTQRLTDVRNLFAYATDKTMIDALIYEENSVLCLLDELYKFARSEAITIQPHERHRI